MIDRNNSGSSIGQELLAFSDDVFHWWYRVRDGALRRRSLRTYIAEQRPWLRTLLEEGSVCGCAKTAGVCRELLKLEPALWTFLRVEGVGPTNNAAERALRCVAVGRNNWTFAGSDEGGRRAAAIYTLIETAKLNDIDPRAWLADVLARLPDHPARRICELLPWNWKTQIVTAVAA
ncbi:MAG TPA: transposase domain-containing protein, partial [Burkholderiaceae bacterium]